MKIQELNQKLTESLQQLHFFKNKAGRAALQRALFSYKLLYVQQRLASLSSLPSCKTEPSKVW